MHNTQQLSIADQQFSQRKKTSRTAKMLDKIKTFVDWSSIEKQLSVIDKTQNGKGGRPPLPLSWKIKMLFVQFLYNLSDPKLEDELIDNLSFQRFVGINWNNEIPDFTTLWRFKEALIEHHLSDQIFELIQQQLEGKGLLLKRGTVVDATIIQSKNRPLSNKTREQLQEQPSTQIDTDAKSTKKNGQYYFGYKGHIGVDEGSKLIRKRTFTAANKNDCTELENLMSGDEKSIWADKAYPTEKHKRAARFLGIYFGILDKAKKGQPLSNKQRKRNKQKSAVRAIVEHPFAFIKSKLKYTLAWATNLVRNQLRFDMNCIIYNILRASYLLKQQRAVG